jgi:hypothetical protein
MLTITGMHLCSGREALGVAVSVLRVVEQRSTGQGPALGAVVVDEIANKDVKCHNSGVSAMSAHHAGRCMMIGG